MSFLSGLGKFFGKFDPTMGVLGALSLFGGDDGPKSFDKTSADPVRTLTDALAMAKGTMGNIQARGPARLRSSYVPARPVPVNVPGVPFQIGGGLGTDPAMDDPSLLEGSAPVSPIQGAKATPKPSPNVRRRTS